MVNAKCRWGQFLAGKLYNQSRPKKGQEGKQNLPEFELSEATAEGHRAASYKHSEGLPTLYLCSNIAPTQHLTLIVSCSILALQNVHKFIFNTHIINSVDLAHLKTFHISFPSL